MIFLISRYDDPLKDGVSYGGFTRFSHKGPVDSVVHRQVKDPPGNVLQVPPYLQGDFEHGEWPEDTSLPGVVAESGRFMDKF